MEIKLREKDIRSGIRLQLEKKLGKEVAAKIPDDNIMIKPAKDAGTFEAVIILADDE